MTSAAIEIPSAGSKRGLEDEDEVDYLVLLAFNLTLTKETLFGARATPRQDSTVSLNDQIYGVDKDGGVYLKKLKAFLETIVNNPDHPNVHTQIISNDYQDDICKSLVEAGLPLPDIVYGRESVHDLGDGSKSGLIKMILNIGEEYKRRTLKPSFRDCGVEDLKHVVLVDHDPNPVAIPEHCWPKNAIPEATLITPLCGLSDEDMDSILRAVGITV